MGLFSEKVHTIGVSAQRVLRDNQLPNAMASGVYNSILGKDSGEQLVENILDSMLNGLAIRADRMYSYGKNSYMFGLPKATILDSTAGVSGAIEQVLTLVLGYTPTLEYAHFGAPNLQHFAWKKLCDVYAYDPPTNRLIGLEASKGAHTYLLNFTLHIPQSLADICAKKTLEQWGRSPLDGYAPWGSNVFPRAQTPIQIHAEEITPYAEVSFCWGKGIDKQGTMTVLLDGLDFSQEYFQAQYSQYQQRTVSTDGPDVIVTDWLASGFWVYREGEGTEPALDLMFSTTYDELGSFFPWGYFRNNKQDVLDQPTSEEYKQSKKLMGFLGMDFKRVGDAIKENPDINDVQDALLMLAVPANTSNPLELRYLYEFFFGFYTKTGGDATYYEIPSYIDENGDLIFDFMANFDISRWMLPDYGMVIQDTRFKMAISVDTLIVRTKPGTLGEIGSFHHKFQTGRIKLPTGLKKKTDVHYYRKQITGTLYQEIMLTGLAVKFHSDGKYAATVDETDPAALIPVDCSITELYSMTDREELYARSLHYVITSHVVTKLKWYQTTFFQWIIVVVAVVITILCMGADGGETLSAALALASAGAWDLLWALLAPILENILFSLVATKIFVKLAGEKLAFLAAILTACYGMLGDYFQINLPYADTMMEASTSLIKEVNNVYADKIAGIQEDMEDFSEYASEQQAKLEEAQNLLENDSINLNPFVVFGESPHNYFNRTVHSGNIGTSCFDILENYVDLSLRLPEFSQTMA